MNNSPTGTTDGAFTNILFWKVRRRIANSFFGTQMGQLAIGGKLFLFFRKHGTFFTYAHNNE
jgi:hypothetical protein